MDAAHPELLWVVILCGIMCVIMAMAMGANDVANAFAASVGSGSLSLGTALCLAFIFEIFGALVLGGAVTDAIRKKVLRFEAFEDAPVELGLGMLAASTGTASWLVISTWFGMPVSTTHSIIGALAGFGVASGRVDSIYWMQILYIIISWLVLPISAVLISGTFYILIQEVFLKRSNIYKTVFYLEWLFLFVGCIPLTIFISYENPLLKAEGDAIGAEFAKWFKSSLGNRLICILVIHFTAFFILTSIAYAVTYCRINSKWSFVRTNRKLTGIFNFSLFKKRPTSDENEAVTANSREIPKNEKSINDIEGAVESPRVDVNSDQHKTEVAFSAMQIIAALVVIISHSANDAANAVAPFATVMLLYRDGLIKSMVSTPWYLLLCGGACMSLGLSILGYKVIQTVGLNLLKVTPSRGYVIDTTVGNLVIFLCHLGIPVSSTQCAVSSALGVGLVLDVNEKNNSGVPIIALDDNENQEQQPSCFKTILARISTKNVSFALFKKILVLWVSTMFFSGIISALLFIVVKFCVKLAS
ncbi:Phosphate transporter [Babesia duncani]|uniref:Phosphate transporter n=1 Tax=Babesia duncani TaxID=323732 RepID=A0AAD9UN08_9APIC|nr:Phosphate transporter [Babesia duncani]